MNRFSDLIEKATRQAFRMEGNNLTLTFGAQVAATFQGDIRTIKDIETGGFVQDFDSVFYCIKRDFTTVPAVGDVVTVDSVNYRVTATNTSTNDPAIELRCIGLNQ